MLAFNKIRNMYFVVSNFGNQISGKLFMSVSTSTKSERAPQSVVIIGAGIAGLFSALALQKKGLSVTLLDREAQLDTDPEKAGGMRKGAPQALHPHVFLGRLTQLLKDHYPNVIDVLIDAGAERRTLHDFLPLKPGQNFKSSDMDARLVSLSLRRSVFEKAMRDYVLSLHGISLIEGASVVRLLRDEASSTIQIDGVVYRKDGAEHRLEADVTVDASGRSGKFEQVLTAAGIDFSIEQQSSEIWYLTRHYKLRPDQDMPKVHGLPGISFDDYYMAITPGDRGTFMISYQVFAEDEAIKKALTNPDHFQAMAMKVPVVAEWVDPARAEPVSAVFGFAGMDSYWKSFGAQATQIENFFCVGDSLIRSNPKFGRGCTWSSLAAHELAGLIASDLAPSDKLAKFEHYLESQFRSDWETMRMIDRQAIESFRTYSGLQADSPAAARRRKLSKLIYTLVGKDPYLFREIWSEFSGFEKMNTFIKRPSNWFRLVRNMIGAWLKPASIARSYIRPTRAELAGEGSSSV